MARTLNISDIIHDVVHLILMCLIEPGHIVLNIFNIFKGVVHLSLMCLIEAGLKINDV